MDKKIIKDFFNFIFKDALSWVAIIGFLVTVLIPDIASYKINISLAWTTIVILILSLLICASLKTAQKYYRKKFKFIETKQTEQGNNIYWFASDYFLNIGDTIKLLEYSDTDTYTNICIAKVQQKSEAGHVGILPIIIFQNINVLENHNCKIKPINIGIDDITQISQQLAITKNLNNEG